MKKIILAIIMAVCLISSIAAGFMGSWDSIIPNGEVDDWEDDTDDWSDETDNWEDDTDDWSDETDDWVDDTDDWSDDDYDFEGDDDFTPIDDEGPGPGPFDGPIGDDDDPDIPDEFPPIANIEAVDSAEINENIVFDGSGSYDPDGDIVSYEWDFGDESSGNGVNVEHVYTDEGVYTIRLTVTDDDGKTDTDRINIEVIDDGDDDEDNNNPVITSRPVTEADVGMRYNYDVDAYDPDNNSLSECFSDVLEQGETSSGLCDGKNYQVKVNYIDRNSPEVKFEVNGELTNNLGEGDMFVLLDGTVIGVNDIIIEEAGEVTGDQVDFFIGKFEDNLTYSLTESPQEMTIDSETGLIEWVPEEEGEYDVTVIVEDGNGGSDSQPYTIIVEDDDDVDDEEIIIDNKLAVRAKISSDEYMPAGDIVRIRTSVENIGTNDLENIKISASIQKLAVRDMSGSFNLNNGDETSKNLQLRIPEYAEQGTYTIKLSFSNDDMRRIIYREITVI